MLQHILLAPHVSTYIIGTTFQCISMYIIGITSYGLYYWHYIYGLYYWHYMPQHVLMALHDLIYIIDINISNGLYYWYHIYGLYYWHYMRQHILMALHDLIYIIDITSYLIFYWHY